MTVRYSCGLVVAVVASVGIVRACCGPACPPSGCLPPVASSAPAQPATAIPHPACPPSPCTGYPVAQPISLPASPPTWGLAVVDGKLLLETAEGGRSASERLTILVVGAPPVEVTVAGTAMRFGTGENTGGGALTGTAERATRSGPGGALLTLEGNATLVYVRKGKKAEVTADRVSVNLATGQVVGEMETRPQQPCPVTPCTAAPSEPGNCWRGAGQEFSFTVGISR